MPKSLIIDTAGGSDFGGYNLRNVMRLHVGGAGLPSGAYALQVTGDALVTGGLYVTGDLTVASALSIGAIKTLLITPDTADGADTAVFEIGGGGAAAVTRGAFLQLYGNEHANTGDLILYAGNPTGIIQLVNNYGIVLEADITGKITIPSLMVGGKNVTEGVADSGGAGFKVLRVPN